MRSLALALSLSLALGGCILQQRATLGGPGSCSPATGASWDGPPFYDALPDAAARAGLVVGGVGLPRTLAALDPGILARFGPYSVVGVSYVEGLDRADLFAEGIAAYDPSPYLQVTVLGTQTHERFAQLLADAGLPASLLPALEANATGGAIGAPGSPARFSHASLAERPDFTPQFEAAVRDAGIGANAGLGNGAIRDGPWQFMLGIPVRTLQVGDLTLTTDTHGHTSAGSMHAYTGPEFLAKVNATFADLGLPAPSYAGLLGNVGCKSF